MNLINDDSNITTLDDDLDLSFEKYFAATNLTRQYEDLIDKSENENYAICNLIKVYQLKFSTASYATSGTLDTKTEEVGTFESEDPFDSIDEFKDNDEKVEEVISFLEKGSKLDYSVRLANRLKYLFEVSIEEYPDEESIAPESLRYCLSFLHTAKNFKYPTAVLTPLKNIRLQWRTSPNKHFAVEFLSSGDAHFVIFAPDNIHPEKIKRLSGITSVENLLETITSQGVLSWCSK